MTHFIQAAEELRDAALERRHYVSASKFAALAEVLAQRNVDQSLATAVHAHNISLQEWPRVQTAITVLDGKPDDPEANLLVGRFLSFMRGEWAEGLKFLARGSDPQIKTLAIEELAQPTSAEEQKLLADGWWDAGARQDQLGQMQAEYHAATWYRKARGDLPSTTQAAIDARIKSLARFKDQLPAIGALPDDPRMPQAKASLLMTLKTGAAPAAYGAAFSADGRQVVGYSSEQFWVWDNTTGVLSGRTRYGCPTFTNRSEPRHFS